MSEHHRSSEQPAKWSPDLVLLLAGLFAMLIAAYVLLGSSRHMHWLLAGVAVVGGLGLLVASLRDRQ